MANFLGIRQRLAPIVRMDETDTNDDANLKLFVRSGQEELESAYEWPFLIQRDVTLAVTNSTDVIGLPSDFREVVEIAVEDNSQSPDDRWKLEELSVPMPKGQFESVQGSDPLASQNRGDPKWYTIEYLSGTPQLVIFPRPDANFTLHLKYFTRLSELSADGDTNYFTNNYPDLLVAWSEMPAFKYLGDKDAYLMAEAAAKRKLERVIQQVASRSSGPTRFEPDPYFFAQSNPLSRFSR